MSDLINRQDAIDALDDEITITGKTNAVVVKDYVQRVKRKLEQLPSAQPEIIRCKDCKRYGQDNCFMKIQMLWKLEPNDFCSYAERRGEEDEIDRC